VSPIVFSSQGATWGSFSHFYWYGRALFFVHELSAHACSSIRAFDWGAWSSPVEAAMNDTVPHDTSGGAASANTVRGRSGSTVGPSGSHYIIGPLQRTSGPRKKKKPRCLIFGTRTISQRVCIISETCLNSLNRPQVGACQRDRAIRKIDPLR